MRWPLAVVQQGSATGTSDRFHDRGIRIRRGYCMSRFWPFLGDLGQTRGSLEGSLSQSRDQDQTRTLVHASLLAGSRGSGSNNEDSALGSLGRFLWGEERAHIRPIRRLAWGETIEFSDWNNVSEQLVSWSSDGITPFSLAHSWEKAQNLASGTVLNDNSTCTKRTSNKMKNRITATHHRHIHLRRLHGSLLHRLRILCWE